MPRNKYSLIILSLLMLFNSGCIQFGKYKSAHYRSGNPPFQQIVTYHEVRPGETLYSIAFEYGHDHRDVAQWNNIPKPYTIYPKQKIRVIPIASDTKTTLKFTKNNVNTKRPRESRSVPAKNITVSNSKLKWLWPTSGKVVSTFSYRDPGRRGIDIAGRKGQAVKAAAAGTVVYKGNGLRGYGNLIILKHNDTYFSAYAHTDDVVVNENEKVKLGQKLADMSDTNSEKIQLHFEIRRNGKSVDPIKYLPKRR